MRLRRQALLRTLKRDCQTPEQPMAEEPQASSAWAFAVGLSILTLRVIGDIPAYLSGGDKSSAWALVRRLWPGRVPLPV
jgi:hypothetical protein